MSKPAPTLKQQLAADAERLHLRQKDAAACCGISQQAFSARLNRHPHRVKRRRGRPPGRLKLVPLDSIGEL